ncbi:MAG TPA: hypothetical protein VIM34_19150 [Burkholderiaceae bacterium]
MESMHDASTQGVYETVRHGGGAALALTASAARRAGEPQPQRAPRS